MVMRWIFVAVVPVCFVACPKGQEAMETATTAGTTVMVSSTTAEVSSGTAGPTTGPTTGTTTGTTTGATTGEDCDNSFIGKANCSPECTAGEICVYWVAGDVGGSECRPNKDGCVPSDPCSPACAAVCGGDVCAPVCGGLSCLDPVTCWIGEGVCGDGQKCVPLDALGEDTWNGTACVPIDPRPDMLGEPCTSEGKTGVDSCEKDAFCQDGVCVALCSEFGAACLEGSSCVNYVSGVLQLCEPDCDPLVQQCPVGKVCVGLGEGFSCVTDGSGDAGQVGDVCEYVNACDPGLACVASGVPDCAGARCCTPWCDLSAPNTCPVPGQMCAPWSTDPVPGYENVGVCRVP